MDAIILTLISLLAGAATGVGGILGVLFKPGEIFDFRAWLFFRDNARRHFSNASFRVVKSQSYVLYAITGDRR